MGAHGASGHRKHARGGLSLAPDEVRTLKEMSAAHYLPLPLVRQAGNNGNRSITRSQIELVAGRVSALNECYYFHAESVNVGAMMDGSNPKNIEHGDELLQLAEAVFDADESTLAPARDAAVAALGTEGMIDAVGVATNFMRMVRIADSTGITLGAMESKTEDLRDALGINQFAPEGQAN